MRSHFSRSALPLTLLASVLALAACGDDDVTPSMDSGPPDGGRTDASIDAGMSMLCRADRPLGAACTGITECDNGCFCDGAERCEGNVCVAGTAPCTDTVECTTDSCNESVRSCAHVPSAAACSDDNLCNGGERCDAELGCVPGSALVCNDDDTCTTDTCEAAIGCVNEPQDRDGDGFGDGFCGGTDCVDDPALGGASVGPGMPEICDNNLDDDCDGLRDYATPSCTPTNDTCATARLLPGAGSYSGSTRGLVDNYALACPDAGGGSLADAVFRVSLAEPRDILVRARGGRTTWGGGSITVTVRRFEDCTAGPDVRGPVCGSSASVRVRSAAAGDYAIIVKSDRATPFDLILGLEAPTPVPPIDVCDGSTLDVTAGGTFTGSRGDLSDNYALSCNARVTGALDAAYRLVLDSPRDVRVDLRSQGAIALVRDCALPATTLGCAIGGFSSSASLFRRALPAGTYFLVAEPDFSGRGGPVDDFTIDVRVTAPSVPPPADSCGSAAPLTSGVEVSTALDALTFDVGLSCSPPDYTLARDLVYVFTTTTSQDVTLRAITPTSPFMGDAPTLSLSTTCGDATGERSCGSAPGTSSVQRTWRSLPAGTWYAVVGTGMTSGSVRTQLTLAPATPPPANDNCVSPTLLTSGVAQTFVPSTYDDDVTLACLFSPAADAMYRFVLPRRQNVDLFATAVGSGDPIAVAIRSACATGPDLECITAAGMTAAVSTVLDAGTYFVIVEAPTSVPQVRITPNFSDP